MDEMEDNGTNKDDQSKKMDERYNIGKWGGISPVTYEQLGVIILLTLHHHFSILFGAALQISAALVYLHSHSISKSFAL